MKFLYFVIQVIQREPWEHIKDENIKKAAASFCGEIWQVPPMFSAIKVRFLSHFLVSILSLGKFPGCGVQLHYLVLMTIVSQ